MNTIVGRYDGGPRYSAFFPSHAVVLRSFEHAETESAHATAVVKQRLVNTTAKKEYYEE